MFDRTLAPGRIPAVCCLTAVLASTAAAQLKPADRLQFFASPDRAATLEWTLDPAGTHGSAAFEITDFSGRSVLSSEAPVREGGRIALPIELPRGYYEIAFPQHDQRFGLCVVPEPAQPADPFFCIDSALSWLEGRDDVRDVLARILKRAGVVVSRERTRWRSIHPGADRWEWQTESRYEALRQCYARAGVGVLEMAHDTPGWMGPGRGNPYPSDLRAAARSWGRIERRWHPYWTALEIWNEPDIFFGGNLPADQYVQLVKAVAYGLRDAQPATTLVGGALTDICPDEYRQSCTRNGLLDHVDAVSFHTYSRADRVQAMVEMYRAWLKESGRESMPLWITESGRPWKKGPPRPPLQQDAESALDIVMKAVEARACGIASYYAFVYVYYEENDNNFGMMGREVTPLRSMAAYAQAVAALSHKPYRGDLEGVDQAVQRARVFGDDRRSVIVIYTGQVKADASIRLDVPHVRLEGIDGRALSASQTGAIPVPDGLTYVWVESSTIAERLRRDTPAARLWEISRRKPPVRPVPSPIVLQHLFEPQQATAGPRGYTVSAAQAAKFVLPVRVNNFSEQDAQIELSLSGARLPGERSARSIQVQADSVGEVTWTLDLRPVLDDRGECTLTMTARAGSLPVVSPLSIDIALKAAPASQAP